MFEVLALGTLAVAGLAVFGVLAAAVSLLIWLVLLPFKLLGLIFRGFAFLLALPFMAIFGLLGFLLLGIGFFVFIIPVIPLLAIVGIVWWLVRRNRPPAGVATS